MTSTERITRIFKSIQLAVHSRNKAFMYVAVNNLDKNLIDRDKSRIYRKCLELYYKYTKAKSEFIPLEGEILELVRCINKVSEARRKRIEIKAQREYLRVRRSEGQVFWLCSWHDDCAEDHKDWQGKIYVDRFWRSMIVSESVRSRVAAYIRNHDTMSVQDIMRGPVYMTTRPYCRHRFIPVDIDEVLSGSVNSIKKKPPC